jgi:hypothetical protein
MSIKNARLPLQVNFANRPPVQFADAKTKTFRVSGWILIGFPPEVTEYKNGPTKDWAATSGYGTLRTKKTTKVSISISIKTSNRIQIIIVLKSGSWFTKRTVLEGRTNINQCVNKSKFSIVLSAGFIQAFPHTYRRIIPCRLP